MPVERTLRAWTAKDVAAHPGAVFYQFSADSLREIEAAVDEIRRRKVTLSIIEQEDFRVPSFAKDVPDLRRRLDEGFGFVVLRGLDLSAWSSAEMEMVYWGIGNYL